MKHLLLTLALLAPLALAACDNNASDTTTTSSIDVPAMEPAAGDEAVSAATEATTDAAEPATTSDTMTTTTPSGDTVTTTTTTTTEAAPAIAVGEPNPATPAANTCGDHSAWVGKKKADIQTEIDAMGTKVRVMYPDTPATMDYSADRVNVILEKDTDVVTEVRCG